LITKITGKLLAVADEAATLEVDAVEYEVLIPDFNRRQLQSKLGQKISLHTLHYFEGNHKGDGNNACEVRNAGHQNQFDLA